MVVAGREESAKGELEKVAWTALTVALAAPAQPNAHLWQRRPTTATIDLPQVARRLEEAARRAEHIPLRGAGGFTVVRAPCSGSWVTYAAESFPRVRSLYPQRDRWRSP